VSERGEQAGVEQAAGAEINAEGKCTRQIDGRDCFGHDIQPADTTKCHPVFSRKLITSTVYNVRELMCHELRMKTCVTITDLI